MTILRHTVLLAALAGGAAGATSVDFGLAYRLQGGPLWARVGVADVPALGGQLSGGVSTRAADLSLSRTLPLPPLGAATARTDLAVTWAGGVRVGARANAGLGPVALNLGAAYFTAPAAEVDPLAPYAEAPTDLRARGWAADLSARYRVRRDLVAVLGGEFGAQNMGYGGVEYRRDLTRTLSADPEVPDLEPERETVGTLSARLGARAGAGVLAATAGVGYATPAGLSANVDGLLGAGGQYGLSASLGAADLLSEGSTVRLYGVYEPWRREVTPLRAGLSAEVPVGPGALNLTVSGGRSSAGQVGYGARLGYRLTLGGGAGDPAPEPDQP